MNKKKVSIIIGSVMAVFLLSFASLTLFKNLNVNTNKLKGSVYTGSASIVCSNSSLEVGGTTSCTLYANYSDTMKMIDGTVTGNGITVSSVTKLIDGQGNNGARIAYYGLNVTPNENVAVATINLSASQAGTGTVSFSGYVASSDPSTLVNVEGSASISISNPTPQPSSNNSLGSLSVSGANIGTFDPNRTTYGATVANSVTSVTITATKGEVNQTIEGTGTKSLNEGNNVFNVVCTAQNGTSKTYVITINRASGTISSNNNIGSITIMNGNTPVNIGTVSPTKTKYTATVANSVGSVHVSATPADNSATISGNLGDQTLYVGKNNLVINVKAQNGNSKTYTVEITRSSSGGGGGSSQSSVCSLSRLSASGTNLSSNFSSTVYSYTYVVKNSVTSTTISATPTDSKANVQGTGKKDLKVGNNTFNIEVTAENGNKKIYSINITREGDKNSGSNSNKPSNGTSSNTSSSKDSNALLKELVVDGNKMTLTDDNFSYNYTVLYDVTSVKVDAKAKSDKAKVKIVGNNDIQVGKNTIMITVTAEDGSEKIYLINVTRKDAKEKLSSDSKLNQLSINGYGIDFKPNVFKYTVKINREKQLDISYTPSNDNSNVVIIGNDNLSNNSVIRIEVTAEDGNLSVYEITVKKKTSASVVILGSILGILLVGGIAAFVLFLLKNKKEKVSEKPEEVASFSQADVYDEYIKNTTVPAPGVVTEEAAMTAEEPVETKTEEVKEEPVEVETENTPVEENTDDLFENQELINDAPVIEEPVNSESTEETEIIQEEPMIEEPTVPELTEVPEEEPVETIEEDITEDNSTDDTLNQ